MRNIYKYLVSAVAIAAVGLASCMYDDGIDNVRIVEGRPAQVELTFAVENNVEVTTRAAQDEMYEHLVQNIYVFVFNGNQRVSTDKSFFDSEEVDANGNKVIQNYYNKVVDGNERSHGTITFGALSGSGLKVCAIANINISNTNVTRADIGEETQVDLAKLDAITTYSELQQMSIRLNSGNINRGASFMMTGEVTANLMADETTEVEIPLKRADSKITFNVRAENSKYADFTFIPNSFRVVNAPLKSYILPRVTEGGTTLTADMDAATDVTKDFYSIHESQAPKFEVVGDNSGSFTFYMYENLKKPKALINNNTNAGYALREKENKGEDGRNTSYIYAPDNATYVVLTGELSYSFEEDYKDPVTGTQSKITKWLMADVEYVVHLGHSGVANVDDYSTLRNHHYTYNVTIKGVNDLIVEVDRDNDSTTADQDNEQRPGAEGEIVMSAQRVINVDGHYDRANIQLTDTEAKELHFAINTPWESGYDTNGFNTQNNSTVRDYKWVKFLINKEVGQNQNATTFAPYPGDQCYDGGKTATGTAATSAAYGSAVTLRDIRQLSNYLKVKENRDAVMTNGKIYITVFIDEYLYFYDPTADPMSTPANTNYKGVTTADATGLLLWKKSVNQPDRMLHIVKAGEMKYSDDYETSISRSVVTIKQRSIQTFYNVNAESLKSAWGTETINETPKMRSTRTGSNFPYTMNNQNSYTDLQKGQKLAAYQNANTTPNTWAAVISSTEQYGFGSNYNDATYACAIRNRDLNGDGTMQENEIQWYLTSISQLDDLWVGEPCMPSYAKLYDPNNADGYYNDNEVGRKNVRATHYLSTFLGSDTWASSVSPFVYWAEQYGATSTLYATEHWGTPKAVKDDVTGQSVVSVRCVRNLGMRYDATTMPQSFYSVSTVDGNSSISLEYMNINALRTSSDAGNPLPYAYLGDIGYNNSPYLGFYVMPGYYGNNGSTTTNVTSSNNLRNYTTWYRAYQGESPEFPNVNSICPDGWRVPTQREMKIMVRALPNDSWNFRVAPGSSYNYGYLMLNGQNLSTYGNYFGVFYYFPTTNEFNRRVTGSMSATTTGSRAVRCVKDNPNAKHSSAGDYGEGGEG